MTDPVVPPDQRGQDHAPDLLLVDDQDVQELFFARGWTDGLPIVPPTPDRIQAMIDGGGLRGDEILGSVPERGAVLTVLAAAVNAVMAGCLPAHFPVVVAALEAMLDPAFNAHVAVTSTSGVGLCCVVSGPLTAELGMGSGRNALGSGHRANATIGRTLRLVAINELGAGAAHDGSAFGSPAKYSYCLAEAPPPAPWSALRAELGFEQADTTVTVIGAESPRQVANFTTADPEKLLATIAVAMSSPATNGVQKGCQAVVALGPEHARAIVAAGWSRDDVRAFLADRTRLRPEHFDQAGVVLEADAPKRKPAMMLGPDGRLPTVEKPDDIFVVTAGGPGPGWSAVIQSWIPRPHIEAVTRAVRPRGAEQEEPS